MAVWDTVAVTVTGYDPTRDGGLLVADAALTPEWVEASVPGLLTDPARLAEMGAAARGVIPLDADDKLAHLVLAAAGGSTS